MTNNNNRRGFFRIYQQVNLLYKKIDKNQPTEPYLIIDAKVNKTPALTELERVSQTIAFPRQQNNRPEPVQDKQNDTRNVNLSVSGMAFTCEDALVEDDILEIKLLLASGSKNIVTTAKVVYCKNSNPYENEYPYLVGAQFVDMKDEDRELLSRHVQKKRLQQLWINGFLLAAVLTVLAAPDVVFGLLLGLLHFLLDHVLEFAHIAFEFVESTLDHLVEFLFETGVHDTQIIVFYIIVLSVLYGLYHLWRALPPFCVQCKKNQMAYWSRKKASLLYYWREQSLINKIKLAMIGVTIIASYVFLNM
ncbi:MAG: PilZ domain-containing protein [Methylococcaceae bacterium]